MVAAIKVVGPGEGISEIQAMVIEWVIVIGHNVAILGTLDDDNRSVMIPGITIGMATFVFIAAGVRDILFCKY